LFLHKAKLPWRVVSQSFILLKSAVLASELKTSRSDEQNLISSPSYLAMQFFRF